MWEDDIELCAWEGFKGHHGVVCATGWGHSFKDSEESYDTLQASQ
jgi:hypothetical protein